MREHHSRAVSTRIHAVIMTRDRPVTLERCLAAALATLGPHDVLTVLDDSCQTIAPANAAVLARAGQRSLASVIGLQATHLHDVVAWSSGKQRALWQSRSASRDIAPLRNLALLLTAAIEPETTVLIDDDICGFDLNATHRMLAAHLGASGPAIMGAEIGGKSEQDTVTRLSEAMRLLERTGRNCPASAQELFRVTPDSGKLADDTVRYLSAGYLAFRLPTEELLPFPPGYNEDWLWCLLHSVGDKARLLRSDQLVVHEPPMVRKSTRQDIRFELDGDLILDSVAYSIGAISPPESIRESLLACSLDPSAMPSVRVENLLAQARLLVSSASRDALDDLQTYGLGVMKDMLRRGDLEIDGSARVRAWSAEAVAKQRSFAATLRSVTVRRALQAALWQRMK